jgi:photosystem II stability/assembly factor-like uncharacterized protein
LGISERKSKQKACDREGAGASEQSWKPMIQPYETMKTDAYSKFTQFAIAVVLTCLVSPSWSQLKPFKLETDSTLSKSPTLYDVAFTGEHHVAVGRRGTVLTFTAGETWQPQDSDTDVSLHAVAAGEFEVVAVGEKGTITVSPDGSQCWEKQESGTNAPLRDIAYGNGQFVAVGAYGTILTSTDGRQWQRQESAPGSNFHSVAYGDGNWLISGSAMTLLLSADAREWRSLDTGISSACYGSVAYVDHSFVMTSSQCGIIRSNKNWAWESEVTGKGARLKHITEGDEKTLVAVGKSGVILVSNCPGYWEPCALPANSDLHSVAYGNGRFVAVGARGIILNSEDGVHWMTAPVSTFAANDFASQ